MLHVQYKVSQLPIVKKPFNKREWKNIMSKRSVATDWLQHDARNNKQLRKSAYA